MADQVDDTVTPAAFAAVVWRWIIRNQGSNPFGDERTVLDHFAERLGFGGWESMWERTEFQSWRGEHTLHGLLEFCATYVPPERRRVLMAQMVRETVKN